MLLRSVSVGASKKNNPLLANRLFNSGDNDSALLHVAMDRIFLSEMESSIACALRRYSLLLPTMPDSISAGLTAITKTPYLLPIALTISVLPAPGTPSAIIPCMAISLDHVRMFQIG